MLRVSSCAPLLAAFGLLVACGGKSFEAGDGSDGGSGNSAGSAQAGSAQGATDSGGTGSGGSSNHGGSANGGAGNAGSGGKVSCDASAFDDDFGGNVGVRLVNETKRTIYLGPEQANTCGTGALFKVLDASGEPLLGPAYCQATCAQLLSGNVIGCPAIACVSTSVITLAPGESTLTHWSGLYSERLTLPPACWAAGEDTSCLRTRGVEDGAYYFTAQAGSSISCTQPDLPGSCSCVPDPGGGCTTYDSTIAGPLLHAKAPVQLDSSYGIGGPGGGMARTVEIVFSE